MINTLYIMISTGFAIFSMFFGSGNLVFPLALGEIVGGSYGYALTGLACTAIMTPLLGLFALLYCEGKEKVFFRPLGKALSTAIPLIIILIIGPFGGIPRCITVAHGSMHLVTEHVSLVCFSLLSIGVIYIASFDEEKVMPILGTILTPFLLLSLSLIVYYGIIDAPSHVVQMPSSESFLKGLHIGYQTMDLLAAIFFAPAVIHYMKRSLKGRSYSKRRQLWIIRGAFIIGGALLCVIYGCFIYLGGSYSDILSEVSVESGLATIAFKTLGGYAGSVVSIAIIVACLTTAIILVSVCAHYLRQNIFNNKISRHKLSISILSVAFTVSIFSFEGIVWALSPVLEVFYPLLILLTFYTIIKKVRG